MDTPSSHAPASHARIPAPIVWVQDHLLLGLLMIGSGVINARFLVYGLVPNINDPSTWGFINTLEIFALALAGLALGGLEVRISYKLGECISNRQGGRAIFLAFGMLVLAFIEFWASYSQRSQNIPVTSADSALLGLFNLQSSSLNVTAICIALAIPFISIFWGFAADDPAPKPVEDPATLLARLENERLLAEHRAEMKVITMRGNRAAMTALVARPIATASDSDEDAPADNLMPLPVADSEAFTDLVAQTRDTIKARGGDAGVLAIIGELEAIGYATPSQEAIAHALVAIGQRHLTSAQEASEPTPPVANDIAPRPRDRVRSKPAPDSPQYPTWVYNRAAEMQRGGKHLTYDGIAEALGEPVAQVQAALETIRTQRVSKLRSGERLNDLVLSAL